jgi:hypothetical protein
MRVLSELYEHHSRCWVLASTSFDPSLAESEQEKAVTALVESRRCVEALTVRTSTVCEGSGVVDVDVVGIVLVVASRFGDQSAMPWVRLAPCCCRLLPIGVRRHQRPMLRLLSVSGRLSSRR